MRMRSALALATVTAAVLLGAAGTSAADTPTGSGGRTQSVQRTGDGNGSLLDGIGLRNLLDRTGLNLGGLSGR
ncbi:hypothetical protein [Streptomyces sp. NPDC018031]|uniref:hypothetical protein n=1 Tax=Streptomyces sp. NPDC018031 TaxID=3365033 RepID=UPI0037A147F1